MITKRIACHRRTVLAQFYLVVPLEAIFEDDWLHTNVAVITTFNWLNDITNLLHNAFMTSVISSKTVFDFHLIDILYALKSDIDA